MIKIIICIILLSGCTIHAGIGVHSPLDEPEVRLSNPLGIVSIEKNINNGRFICTHISSLYVTEVGLGLNTCAAMIKFK